MIVDHSAELKNVIASIWEEVDRRFRTDTDMVDESLLSWLNMLGILQSQVDGLELDREDCGLPSEDADVLFIRYSSSTN